eukprot:1963823-Rhodomonas_salina.2
MTGTDTVTAGRAYATSGTDTVVSAYAADLYAASGLSCGILTSACSAPSVFVSVSFALPPLLLS